MSATAYLALLWQLPLALLSLLSHRVLKAVFLVEAARRGHVQPNTWGWQGVSQALESCGAVWFVMIVGPRWNCHAVLGDLGPMQVRRTIDVRPVAPLLPSQHLSFVVYDTGYRCVGYRVWTATSVPAESQLEVEPGIYRVSARLYGFEADDRYPQVDVDGTVLGDAKPIGDELERYQQLLLGLQKRRSLFLGLIHYYVFLALRWRHVFGERLVERLFVPVGNPATVFSFGIIRRGQRLTVERLGDAAGDSLVFVAIYDWASLPVYWATVSAATLQLPPADRSGYFLLRSLSADVGAGTSTSYWLSES